MRSLSVTCIGLVVADLHASKAAYERLLGVREWQLREARAERGSVDDFSTTISYTAARARLSDDMSVELIQPAADGSSFYRQLAQRGEGVHHLEIAGTQADIEALLVSLSRRGISTRQTLGEHEVWFDTRRALGGWLLKIGCDKFLKRKSVERNVSSIWMRPQSLVHLGVVVQDVFATTKAFSLLLGVTLWNVDDWRTGDASLTGSLYRGSPVNHGYLSATASLGSTGFEIVEPTFGPSHYKEDFLDTVGEGVHHLYLAETTDGSEWDRLHESLERHGLKEVMSSALLGDVADFAYVDTADLLGGVTVEIARMRPGRTGDEFVPTFTIDYSQSQGSGVRQS